jgi:hypothetical protein
MKYGVSIALFPTSWEVGHARIRNKNVVAFGPIRLSLHRVQGSLKDYSDA